MPAEELQRALRSAAGAAVGAFAAAQAGAAKAPNAPARPLVPVPPRVPGLVHPKVWHELYEPSIADVIGTLEAAVVGALDAHGVDYEFDRRAFRAAMLPLLYSRADSRWRACQHLTRAE